jgi:hypothetical protein
LMKGRCVEKRQSGTLRMERGIRIRERAPYMGALAAGRGGRSALGPAPGGVSF